MRMYQLAMQNFKRNFQNYLALIVSLAFTVLVFLNFQNILASDIFDVLSEQNRDRIDMLIRAILFVLGCFMFFFLWYSTNVFLTKRKKEIGIFIFMGLTNQNIGFLYLIETVMIGVSALLLGVGIGILTTWLFQMILLAISEISVDISFTFQLKPVLLTSAVYLAMYLVFSVKGYVNIIKSSVLEMVSAARQREYVRQNTFVLAVKTVLGIVILAAGYYLAIKEGGQEVLGNVLAAVVLVVIGIYFVFGGFLPFLFVKLAKKKLFLYQKERVLWMNNVIFRIKKNYRTYAITCVMMLCSVTALATGSAMKARYQGMVHFRNTYTYQFLSNQKDLDKTARELIEKDNEIAYSTKAAVLALDTSLVDTRFRENQYGMISYSQIKQLAKEAGLEFELAQPGDDEIIKVSQLHMLSLLTDRSHETVTINGKTYRQTVDTSVPYLGYFQEIMSFYLVNDEEYERLLPLGEELYTFNYKITDIMNFAASKDELEAIVSNTEDNYTARVMIDPNNSDIEWIKVLYTIGIFMFLVFVLASGSILFMKLYNDAFEEKERYQILRKIGMPGKLLKKSISRELLAAYALPFLVMMVSARFSVHALEKMMTADLIFIYLNSVAVIFVIFFLCYQLSLAVYVKNAGV